MYQRAGGRTGRYRPCRTAMAVLVVAGLLSTAGVVTQTPLRADAASGFTPLDLGTLGGPTSSANAISNSGQVVGSSDLANGGVGAFSWTAAGGMVNLGSLDPSYSYDGSIATAVNDHGQVVGVSEAPSGGNSQAAFSWTARGGIVNLGSLGGDQTGAVAVNDNGEVVGTSDGHLFAWTAGGGMVDLGGLGGGSASPSALNNSGQVVGTGYTATGYFHAFSYTKGGGMVDLGTLGGSNSFATAVSATGEVVGFSQTAHNAATDVSCGPPNTAWWRWGVQRQPVLILPVIQR